MPFVLNDKKTYRFPCTVKRPNETTGKWEAFEFSCEFNRRSRPEIEAIFKAGAPNDAEIVATEFVGWAGVKQPDGSDLEVNDSNRVVLLAEPFVQAAIVRAWLESAVTGPQKNS